MLLIVLFVVPASGRTVTGTNKTRKRTSSNPRGSSLTKAAGRRAKKHLENLEDEFSKPLSSKNLSSYDYLYVGASKPYLLGQKVKKLDKKIYFNCAPGARIDFFFYPHKGKEALLPVIRKFLKQHPDGIVISEMSGNDLSHLSEYIQIYQAIQEHYPMARLALLDMLPGAKGLPKNKSRKRFNEALHTTFGPWDPVSGGCLYGYDHLYKHHGFRTLDGTHYPDSMKRVTYEYIMKKLGRPVKIKYKSVSKNVERWIAITEVK